MGGKHSKTKPNDEPALSRKGILTTFIVTVDPSTETQDDLNPNERAARTDDGQSHSEARPVRTSKVQEILEGKVELKKQQLEHLPQSNTHIASLDLQFSSSEDSDDDDGAGKKKRKGATKKRKKKHSSDSAVLQAGKATVKSKLNDIKAPKRGIGKKDHFEQIKDAYALAEYTSKEKDDEANSPTTTSTASPPKTIQKLSSSSSPSKLFGSAFEMWRNPSKPQAPNRSISREHRDASRQSTPKTAQSGMSDLSNQSGKSSSSPSGRIHSGRRQQSGSDSDSDIDLQELEFETQVSRYTSVGASPIRVPLADSKVAEERYAVKPEPVKSARSERRNLRIDDTDESIMDNILAEAIT